MRVPTDNMFQQQLNWINQQYERVARLYSQQASGKKLLDNSDDPILASRISLTNDFITQIKSYDQNLVIAENRVKLFDSSISDCANTVDQIKQIIQTASSDVTSDEQRQALVKQLEGYMKVLLNDANMRDGNGDYIYSGYNTTIPPYSLQGNNYVYQGTSNTTLINIGSNVTSLYNESGFNVFGNIPNGNGRFTVTGTSTNTGTASSSSGSVTNSSAYVEDTYTIAFVMNGSGKIGYTITGANSGQVVPPLPAPIPGSAPDYVPDSDVSFNGMNIHFSGNPDAGDSFTVAPSKSQNVFDSLKDLISTMKMSIGNDPVKQAKFHQLLSQSKANFSNAYDHFISNKSDVGTRMQVIENQTKINSNLNLTEESILSQLSNVDPARVATDLSQQLVYLQATQECYVKIQSTLLSILKM